jgi:hypothetical protein
MDHREFIGSVVGGLVILLLPFALPLFFWRDVPRRFLFYFGGLACCFLCYRLATILWGFMAAVLGSLIASWRHEDMQKGFEYTYALILPGFQSGHPQMLLGILPMLMLGTLLSVFTLRMLKRFLLKPNAPPVG